MATYQALYRKYRPRNFEDVSGQEHIVATLKTELSSGRISHAYLFCGTRGTGKTTCAKIFAKAVNCLNLQNGNPCNQCENCIDIDSGTNMDIMEIDAASNNGVDNIRDIRDEVVYSPAKGKMRVYIIDEVHMLSSGAFNALLKTLEEPPSHVLFILATTEAHKIPATIISRCQRFDFRRINLTDITNRILYIAKKEKIEIEPDAARLIAHLADGAMRDALSILDQCACTGQHIDYAFVAQTAGIADSSYTVQLVDAISQKNFSAALQEFDRIYQGNREPSLVCQELISLFRDLLIIKSVKETKDILLTPLDRQQQLPALSGAFTLEEILCALETLQDTLNSLGRSINKRTEMESTLLRLCCPQTMATKEALLARISALEKKLSAIMAGGISVKSDTQPAPFLEAAEPPSSSSAPQTQPESAAITISHHTEPANAVFWNDVIAETNSSAYKGVLKGFLEETTAYFDGDTLTINTQNLLKQSILSKPEALQDIKVLVHATTGKYYKVKIADKAKTKAPDTPDALINLAEKIRTFGTGGKVFD